MTPITEEQQDLLAPYFDAAYYRAAYPHTADSEVEPIEHYLREGWRAGLNPSRQFDTRYYLRMNADVAARGMNPLFHYALTGKQEQRPSRRPLDAERVQLEASRAPREGTANWRAHADRSDPLPYESWAGELVEQPDGGNLIVSISHDDYRVNCGGVQNIIGDEQQAFGGVGWHYLHLSPAVPLPMLADDDGQPFNFSVRLNDEARGRARGQDVVAAIADRRAHGDRVEVVIHHMMGHRPELLAALIEAAGTRPMVWGHDFFSLCPSYALMRNDVRHCGAPPPRSAACTVCVYGPDRLTHEPRMEAFFAQFKPIMLFPSEVARAQWQRQARLPHKAAVALPLARLVVEPTDDEARPSTLDTPIRVAHLGARVGHKGWTAFEELALALAQDDRYAFYQLGHPGGPALPGCIRTVPVRVDAENRDAMIEAAARSRIDVVVSWSMWPETFCFVVHEALAAGAFVVARAAAGNVWPAVQAQGGNRGCAVQDEARLLALFQSGEIVTRLATADRRRAALLRGHGTADWLLRTHRQDVQTLAPTSPPAAQNHPALTRAPLVHCFTSATFAYLDRVRVLGETLRRHHPNWTLWLCLADQEPVGLNYDPAHETFDHVVRLHELGIPDLERWVFDHDVVELCTAVKGQMLCRLLEGGAEKVVYLDPDIAVLSDLSEIEALLDRHPIILTPHQLVPDTDRAVVLDNEIGSLKYGIYNLGFLAVANTGEGLRFARWWRDRLIDFCFDDVPNGLFTDQRWCDHVPSMFDNVHILRDPGYNVASWNLSQRPITIDPDGVVRAAGRPLRFFHFTKVSWVGQIMLERYAGGRIEVFELLDWYCRRLSAHAVDGLPPGWWAYGRYTDGTPVPRDHRVTYRTRVDLRLQHPHPFNAGPGMFG